MFTPSSLDAACIHQTLSLLFLKKNCLDANTPTLPTFLQKKRKRFLFEFQHQELLSCLYSLFRIITAYIKYGNTAFPCVQVASEFFFSFLHCFDFPFFFFLPPQKTPSPACSLSSCLAPLVYRQASSFISLFFLTSSACLSCQTNTETQQHQSHQHS